MNANSEKSLWKGAHWWIGAALLVLLLMGAAASRQQFFWWDPPLASWIQSVELPLFGPLMHSLSLLGARWWPFLLVGATGAILILRKKTKEGVVCMAGVGLGALANRIIKIAVDRPRPDPELLEVLVAYPNESFPSGHVVFYVQFCGFLLYLLWKHRGAFEGPAYAAALAILPLTIAFSGVSRVFEGAHWPSDVLGGYVAGSIWLYFMIR
ncbi:MAG TPA: phosphatase PAP2 family protein, partial [Acidobacteriota bacterium]|nr:phosphatase PAP2 family protein [Acidobacteriota bacterium]